MKNKKGLIGKIGFILISLLVTFAIIMAVVIIPMDEDKMVREFCKDNGYDNFERASFRWESSYCIKNEGNGLIKKEIDTCNYREQTLHDYCFVEMEASHKTANGK